MKYNIISALSEEKTDVFLNLFFFFIPLLIIEVHQKKLQWHCIQTHKKSERTIVQT